LPRRLLQIFAVIFYYQELCWYRLLKYHFGLFSALREHVTHLVREEVLRRSVIRSILTSAYHLLSSLIKLIPRIPFTLAGTVYGKYLAVDLGRFALKGSTHSDTFRFIPNSKLSCSRFRQICFKRFDTF
jgi:hypothetical protein